jgi:hypothetical protein
MSQFWRIARAALAAALVASCSSSVNDPTRAGSAVCSGDPLAYWASEGGQAEVTQADLDYLATFDACTAFGIFTTAAELAAFLEGAGEVGAAADYVLCAQWFGFALNALHERFTCDGGDVRFALADLDLTFSNVAGAVVTSLALPGEEDGAALTAFFADANAGATVCVCEEPTGGTGGSGGTGGTGGTGSWGE